jgi:hypothetical protein
MNPGAFFVCLFLSLMGSAFLGMGAALATLVAGLPMSAAVGLGGLVGVGCLGISEAVIFALDAICRECRRRL